MGQSHYGFCKNTFQRMTTTICRISARLNIPSYFEFAEEQGQKNEDVNVTSIEVSMF